MTAPDRVEYDEFGLFHENAAEYDLPFDGPPPVRREHVEVEAGRRLSALVVGSGRTGGGPAPRRFAERPHLGHGRDGVAPDGP